MLRAEQQRAERDIRAKQQHAGINIRIHQIGLQKSSLMRQKQPPADNCLNETAGKDRQQNQHSGLSKWEEGARKIKHGHIGKDFDQFKHSGIFIVGLGERNETPQDAREHPPIDAVEHECDFSAPQRVNRPEYPADEQQYLRDPLPDVIVAAFIEWHDKNQQQHAKKEDALRACLTGKYVHISTCEVSRSISLHRLKRGLIDLFQRDAMLFGSAAAIVVFWSRVDHLLAKPRNFHRD